MPYLDVEGQCTFERWAGENFRSPENYTCRCPGCSAEVTGKTPNRSISGIASTHKWIVLSQHKGKDIAYCSLACVRAVQPKTATAYVRRLISQQKDLFLELERWTDE